MSVRTGPKPLSENAFSSRARLRVCRRCRLPAWSPARAAKVDTFEQERELGGFHRLRAELSILRPASVEAPLLEPFAPERETVTVPIDDPQAV